MLLEMLYLTSLGLLFNIETFVLLTTWTTQEKKTALENGKSVITLYTGDSNKDSVPRVIQK